MDKFLKGSKSKLNEVLEASTYNHNLVRCENPKYRSYDPLYFTLECK